MIALLVAQGEVSVKALDAFEAWSDEDGSESAGRVRELEHEADKARQALVLALKTALATPISQEDLFVLSERCDRVVNRVKNIVGEAEVLAWKPDSHAAAMASHLRSGVVSIATGFASLTRRSDDTANAADEAIHEVRRVEHIYRKAMAELTAGTEMREISPAREMYRSYVRAAEALEMVADRLSYAVLAEP